MDDALVTALRAAIAAQPDDPTLRLHLADLLVGAGRGTEAIGDIAAVLAVSPGDPAARALMARAVGGSATTSEPAPPVDPAPPAEAAASGPAPAGFDWTAAETDLGADVEPMFVGDTQRVDAFEVESSALRLADVGGMTEVKQHLDAAFLAPLRNEELRRLYGKSLRGGLLMYGPPGCGKTFIARAVAGELGASFITVGLSDLLDGYFGGSERNIHELFQLARRSAPCVVFLDELDAIGQRRTSTTSGMMRGVVVQLLEELDSMEGDNEGVFVLAASNQPWAIDPALRRPGRFDRTLVVLPPDEPAREAILRHHLRDRPVEGIDTSRLAKQTEGYSGADLAFVCERAAERALMDSVATGRARTIGMGDLEAALREVKPSTGPWLESAKNVVTFGEDDGTFAQLKAYLKKARRI